MRAFKITIFLFAIASTINGCAKGYYLPSGGYRPKDPSFKLAEEPCQSTIESSFDTNALYFMDLERDGIEYDSDLFIFYRFFDDGRCQTIAGRGSFPTIEEQNNSNAGIIGYYCVEGEKIQIEIFVREGRGDYKHYWGEVKGDSIHLNEYSRPGLILVNKFWPLQANIWLYKVNDPSRVFLYSKPSW